MKKIIFTLSLFAAIFLFQQNVHAQTGNASPTVFRHIVIITFKPDAQADSIKALDDLYRSLSKHPMVKAFETGVSMSMRDSGIVKHVYVTSFASKDDMNSYRKIPEYPQLFKLSLPIANDVTVADYWANQ
jgi:Stress responsive A/B Barrel Domain